MNVRNSVHKQMANNFVKWWKTKFLNGYRQFTGTFYLIETGIYLNKINYQWKRTLKGVRKKKTNK